MTWTPPPKKMRRAAADVVREAQATYEMAQDQFISREEVLAEWVLALQMKVDEVKQPARAAA